MHTCTVHTHTLGIVNVNTVAQFNQKKPCKFLRSQPINNCPARTDNSVSFAYFSFIFSIFSQPSLRRRRCELINNKNSAACFMKSLNQEREIKALNVYVFFRSSLTAVRPSPLSPWLVLMQIFTFFCSVFTVNSSSTELIKRVFICKARQLYLYSTFHTQGRLKVLYI